MREQIYQNGFYLMLGLLLGVLLRSCFTFGYSPKESIRMEVMNDSIVPAKVSQGKPLKKLNEKTLKDELEKHNIPHASIVLAQAKLESNHFKSDLIRTHQNLFGLKKGNKYRRYSHWTECVKDYKDLISSRYTGGDYYVFLDRIGYATDPNYTKTLKMMHRN